MQQKTTLEALGDHSDMYGWIGEIAAALRLAIGKS
jgi:hypothetical protein